MIMTRFAALIIPLIIGCSVHESDAFNVHSLMVKPTHTESMLKGLPLLSSVRKSTVARGPMMTASISDQATILKPIIRPSEHDLLLRVAKGQQGERTPVWLMRQAGRYMKAFKAYSDKYPFRVRSETPEIAIELSLQPFRAFGTDGVIMFSDILTPLPSMGIEFDVVKGSGPVIFEPLRSADQLSKLKKIDDPDKTAPFLRPILESLRKVALAFSSYPRRFTLISCSLSGD